jgi:hypothetical protein
MGASAMGRSASFPSGDGVTLTKKTGIPFFLNASARAAALLTTLSEAWGAVCRPTMPFWRSMTTSAVFDLSINVFFICVSVFLFSFDLKN